MGLMVLDNFKRFYSFLKEDFDFLNRLCHLQKQRKSFLTKNLYPDIKTIDDGNKELQSFLNEYSLFLKRYKSFLEDLIKEYSLDESTQVKELILFFSKSIKVEIPPSLIKELFLVNKKIQDLHKEIKHLNDLNQDILRNNLKILNYNLELALIKNPIIVNHRI